MTYFRNPVDDRLARYDHLIVHCTATGPDKNGIDAGWVDAVHKNKGWSGCGYHAVITRAGEVQCSAGGRRLQALLHERWSRGPER